MKRNRALWITAAVASATLVVGLAAGHALAAASASRSEVEPGLMTAPVALGELRNELTVRGEVTFADAVDVTLDPAHFLGPAVVTGAVPTVGTELAAVSVALEVAGRPVIVLPGELPAYRTLEVGMTGPDVVQFKKALRDVGLDGGDPASDVFDADAAAGVAALYDQVGYAPPVSAEADEGAIAAAEGAVAQAEQALSLAQNDLSIAKAGPSAPERKAADNAVASAERAVDAAIAADGDDATIADLKDALALAKLEREQLLAGTDTTALTITITAAKEALADAQDALAEAKESALPVLPVQEALFLTELPRRVDAVTATVGAVPEGVAMTVSGARVTLVGSLSEQDAAMLTEGAQAFFPLPGGGERGATVETVAPEQGEGERWLIELTPTDLADEEIAQLYGQNVAVRLPIDASDGEVLSVPAAALTSGPDGQTRVEIVEGDPRDGVEAPTHFVTVETGLATPAGVEIRAAADEDTLSEGDRVVVGR